MSHERKFRNSRLQGVYQVKAIQVSRLAVLAILVTPLLVACGGGSGLKAEVAYFDLGSIVAGNSPATPRAPHTLVLRGVDVVAPSWLATSAMQYRLAYTGGARRQSYGESRWVAPPAELLENILRRRTETDASASISGCRLRVDLDEFIQVFDAPNQSRSLIEARLSLLGARGDSSLGRRVLSLSKAAQSPDALGGVAAFATLSSDAASEISVWLAQLAKESPGLADQCRT